MDAVVLPLLRHLDAVDAMLVRVVSLSGFGLRNAGDGAIATSAGVDGRILGGLADTAIIEAFADGGADRRVLRVTVSDRDADESGMVCGGTARLFLSPLHDVPPLFSESVERAEPVALATMLGGEGDLAVTRRDTQGALSVPGAHGTVLADTVLTDTELTDTVLTDTVLTDTVVERSRAILAGAVSSTELVTIDDHDVVISTIVPTARALIVGSGAMADAIAAQGSLLGWECSIDESLDRGLTFCASAGPADAIVILSHDPELDTPLLDAAIGSTMGFVGAMGSRGTQTNRRKRLAALGHDAEALDRIHGPVGLDLGARTPAETAVAIAAEYLVHRSGRSPRSLRASTGPING